MPTTRTCKQHAITVLLLVGITLLVYLPSVRHDFIPLWDDSAYILANPAAKGLTLGNMRAAFTAYFCGNYAPLHIISYMLDYILWGFNSSGYILTNIILHAFNGALLYFLLIRSSMSKTTAAISAFIFLIHPVQVESVVWISQRKNVLAMAFFLTSFHTYISYRESFIIGHKRALYLASLIFFSLSLLSKAVAVILPLCLIAYDISFQSRQTSRLSRLDKLPFWFLATVVGIITMDSQTPTHGWGGRTSYHGGSPTATFYTMLPVLVRYLRLLFWPSKLTALYSFEVKTGLDTDVLFAGCVCFCLVLAGVWLFRNNRSLFCWFAIFFIGLIPVSQLVPIVTLINDRYLYFPLLGAAPFVCETLNLLSRQIPSKVKYTVLTTLGCLLLVLTILAYKQTEVWQNTESLWEDVVTKDPRSIQAWLYLGEEYYRQKELKKSLWAYKESIKLSPLNDKALRHSGIISLKTGDKSQGKLYLETLVSEHPEALDIQLSLAELYYLDGDYKKAANACASAINIDPTSARAKSCIDQVQGLLQKGQPY